MALPNSKHVVTARRLSSLMDTLWTKIRKKFNKKVDKVTGKGLSTNDFTNTYKSKLDGLDTALSKKVDKVAGKGLSTNDFTNDLKNKLNTAYSASHSHSNKTVLDKINQATLNKIDAAVTSSDVEQIVTDEIDGRNLYVKPTGGIPASDLAGDIPSEKLVEGVQQILVHASSIPADAEANVIEEVQVNGVALTPVNKSVNVVIPACVQANWTEADTSDPAYIQNKPENLVQDADYVHTDNNYTDEDKDKLDNIDLTNYVLVPKPPTTTASMVLMFDGTNMVWAQLGEENFVD